MLNQLLNHKDSLNKEHEKQILRHTNIAHQLFETTNDKIDSIKVSLE